MRKFAIKLLLSQVHTTRSGKSSVIIQPYKSATQEVMPQGTSAGLKKNTINKNLFTVDKTSIN